MKKKIFITLLLAACTFSLTGCKKDKEQYELYKNEVEILYNSVVTANATINNINVYDEESVDTLLKEISEIETSLREFSEVDAPEKYDQCEVLSLKAADCFKDAKEAFDKAFNGETFDEISYNNGIVNINNGVENINYMGLVLQGTTIEFE